MTSKKRRIAGVLKRFQFLDLSRAVSTTGQQREDFLREYTGRRAGRFPTYEPFRKTVKGIYGVSRGLDLSPSPIRGDIEAAVRRECKGTDEAINLDAALSLYDLLFEAEIAAYDHFPESLRLGDDRRCFFRIEHYIVRADTAIFQFPYPRRTRLTDFEYQVMMSLIHYGYVRGDFEEARVEIADLSCEEVSVRVDGRRQPAPRTPRILALGDGDLIGRQDLQTEIEDVYRILLRIADEPDET